MPNKDSIRVITGMVLIILILVGWFYYRELQFNTYGVKVRSTISSRHVDWKKRVTIKAYFTTNNQTYQASDLVTNYETNNNVTLTEGDTVIVHYSKNNPTVNEIIPLSPSHYKKSK